MTRRIMLSVALMLGFVMLSQMSSDSTTIAQQGGRRSVTDTGMLTLGPNEVLRLTVSPKDGTSGSVVRFRRIEYSPGNCNGGGCKHVPTSQTTSDPITLNRGEAATFDIPNTAAAVRGVVLSSSPTVEVRGIVFDTSTQRISAICTFIPD